MTAAAQIAQQLAAQLDQAVWRIVEHREDRTAHLLVESDGVELTVDAPPDRRRRGRRPRAAVAVETVGDPQRVRIRDAHTDEMQPRGHDGDRTRSSIHRGIYVTVHARDRFELRFGPTTSTYQTIVGEVNAALDAGRRSATIPSWALLIPRRGARAGEQSARYAWTEDRSRCYVLQRRAPATAASRHALAGYRERWSVVTVVGHVDDERRQLARHYAADVERAERRSRRNTDYRRLRTEAA